MKLKLIIQIVLFVGIVVLSYFLYESLVKPVRFENEFTRREEVVKTKLKEIRVLEEAYRVATGMYASNLDSMLIVLENKKVPLVKKIGNVPDSLTEAEAIKKGIVKRDTSFITPMYKLRDEKKITSTDEELKRISMIPFSQGERFDVQIDSIERLGFMIPVIEVKAHYNSYLKGMDEQTIKNRIADVVHLKKYPGLKFGSLEQPIIDGNFE